MSTWQLIEAVKRFPILFDSSHTDYHNSRKKDDVWSAVAAELGNNSGEEVKRRWKNVRDTYTNFLRSCKGKGPSADNKTWVWAKQMEPFRPFLSTELTPASAPPGTLSLSTDSKEGAPAPAPADAYEEASKEGGGCPWPPREVEVEDGPYPSEAPTTAPPATPPPRDDGPEDGHKVRTWNVSTESTASLRDVLALLEARRTAGDTHEIDNIFSAYAKTVKTFSRRRQALVKLKMANLMAEQEFLHLDETEAMAPQNTNSATH